MTAIATAGNSFTCNMVSNNVKNSITKVQYHIDDQDTFSTVFELNMIKANAIEGVVACQGVNPDAVIAHKKTIKMSRKMLKRFGH